MNINIIKPTLADALKICEIERSCFPDGEAAKLEQFKKRLAIFPDCFFMATDENLKETGKINGLSVGFINGACVNRDRICDEMFENTALHDPDGRWAAVYGLCVIEDYRKKGIGGMLLDSFIHKAKLEKRAGVILTCKEEKINYYKKFGFCLRGVSESVHGRAVWYDMMLDLT